MKLFHEIINTKFGPAQVTRVSYKDIFGHPLAASFSGWLDKETVSRMIKLYRKNDRNGKRMETAGEPL